MFICPIPAGDCSYEQKSLAVRSDVDAFCRRVHGVFTGEQRFRWSFCHRVGVFQLRMTVMGLACDTTAVTRNRWPSGEGSYLDVVDSVNKARGGPVTRREPLCDTDTAIERLSGA